MIRWIATLQGTAVMIGMAVVAAWSWLKMHDAKVAAKVETNIVRASEKKGAIRAKKAKKVQDAARAPGAVDRLRSDPDACPDCRK